MSAFAYAIPASKYVCACLAHKRIRDNRSRVRVFRNLRDTLLPKMVGEAVDSKE